MSLIDVDAAPALAFGLSDDHAPFVGHAHAHRRHQLLYTISGTLHLHVGDARWMLPPQRAAWIAGGVAHRVDAPQPVALRTVYFADAFFEQVHVEAPAAACSVFAVSTLARELIALAMQWRPDAPLDALGVHVFGTLAGLARRWMVDALPWHLPTARSPALAQAMDFALAHLDEPLNLAVVARAAGLSTRSLSRRFSTEAGMPWRRFLHTARMLQAMELLAQPDARVGDVALAVGFTSFAGFSHAFTRFAGQAPSSFRYQAAPKVDVGA